ncbi:hypothetical protein PV08_09102 [Exophiala spinifera]|uniref:Transcription factor domain-containing protein n=1 Tax=Exophiala spinifera TaxID=91928 RepID=A0A0D2BKN3_9EURO|nr:uncharacterized protein PV08_09102 [Exophiala spinifera]KIW11829.1 hypothetical protein PV08_09102 [Exophiala spinifera]
MSLERLKAIVTQSDATASLLGQGLVNLDVGHDFDQQMLQIFREAMLVWICFEQIGIQRFTTDEKRSISMMRLNIDHRLLSYPFDYVQSQRPVQEACRLAFILFSNAHYNVIQPTSEIARCLVQDLQAALKATDLLSLWGNASLTLIWTLFLGAHLSFGQQERPWFVAMLSRAARKCDLNRWEDVRRCLVLYYYSPRVFEASFHAIWSEVEILTTLLNPVV